MCITVLGDEDAMTAVLPPVTVFALIVFIGNITYHTIFAQCEVVLLESQDTFKRMIEEDLGNLIQIIESERFWLLRLLTEVRETGINVQLAPPTIVSSHPTRLDPRCGHHLLRSQRRTGIALGAAAHTEWEQRISPLLRAGESKSFGRAENAGQSASSVQRNSNPQLNGFARPQRNSRRRNIPSVGRRFLSRNGLLPN